MFKNNADAIGIGLDLRTDGGYVVAPPSRHISGAWYVWEHPPNNAKLAPLPSWVSDLTGQTPDQARAAKPVAVYRDLARNGADDGGRNAALVQLTGHLLRKHIDPLVVLDLMLAWNQFRCRPPEDEDVVKRTVNSICGLELQRRGVVP